MAPPETQALVVAVRSVLSSVGDPDRALAQQAYMKSSMPYRGITAPELRSLLRPLLNDPALQPPDRGSWEAAVRELWDGATHREERYAATALSGHRAHRRWQDPDALALYRHLVVTGAWWDHVDEVASQRVGPILLRHREEVTPLVLDWAQDDDLWLRRSAVISQLTFRDRTDVALLRATIEPNLDDTSFWLRKAIGWALRQYARTDPGWVRATVEEYGDRLPRLSRREALNHL